MALHTTLLEPLIPISELKKKQKIKKKNDSNDIEYVEAEDDVSKRLSVKKSPVLEFIEEIFNPSLKKIPKNDGPYIIPEAVKEGDMNALKDLDENKIIELKEVFALFDTDADGYISENDLRATFIALGKEAPQTTIEKMLSEAVNPLDFDAFVVLMGYKTIELDPEDVLLEAWSKFDDHGTGCVNAERIYYDLISFGDRFTKQEATEALEEAPMIKPKTLGEPVMIDYQAFCRTLCGLRKRRK